MLVSIAMAAREIAELARPQIVRRCFVAMTLAGLLFAVPVVSGADEAREEAAVAQSPATRGTTVQLTGTMPPPPVTAAPAEPAVLRDDTLEVPTDSGTGRRVVYSKGIQRVWLIEADGTLVDTHRVSGRLDQPKYGTYAVWSRSTFTCARKRPDICMRFMVRFAYANSGDNIGFHEIPVRDGVPLQADDELGDPLSGGCVRQATPDAVLMWEWAQLGTVVVVVP